jgi:hypothetical protein
MMESALHQTAAAAGRGSSGTHLHHLKLVVAHLHAAAAQHVWDVSPAAIVAAAAVVVIVVIVIAACSEKAGRKRPGRGRGREVERVGEAGRGILLAEIVHCKWSGCASVLMLLARPTAPPAAPPCTPPAPTSAKAAKAIAKLLLLLAARRAGVACRASASGGRLAGSYHRVAGPQGVAVEVLHLQAEAAAG